MKKFKNVLIGLCFIVVGVLVGLNSLGFIKIDIFFDGWWTLFIIIPCVIGLFEDHDKTGSIIGIIIGTLLLLSCQEVITFEILLKLLIPIILVIIGISYIIKEIFGNKIKKKIEELNIKSNDEINQAIFSSQKINYDKEEFNGTNLEAIFGGIKLDLRNAVIKEDISINANAVFGGIEILVPKNVNVVVTSSCIFGGIDNKVSKKENVKTIYIYGKCAFGGIDIK